MSDIQKDLALLAAKVKIDHEMHESRLEYLNLHLQAGVRTLNGVSIGKLKIQPFREWERCIKARVAISKIQEGLADLKRLGFNI